MKNLAFAALTWCFVMSVHGQNNVPEATMLFPRNNELFRQTFDVMALRARVSDPDGSIQKVQFYQSSTLLGNGERIGTTDEYIFMFGPVQKGNYSFSVVGFDNSSGTKQSWPAHISVAPNAPRYALVELETHPPNFYEEVRGINNHGAIVGFFDDPQKRIGYKFQNWSTEKLSYWDSSDLQPYAVDDDGRTVGAVMINGIYRPFIHKEETGVIPLTMEYSAFPFGVSRAGVVGGVQGNRYQPFFWNGETFYVLQTLGGFQGEARAINNHGVAVGWSHTFQSSNPRAFIYRHPFVTELKANSEDSTLILNAAQAINDQGEIVGSAGDHAFIYSNGSARRLGVLGAEHVARDINEQGIVVGTFSHEFKPSAFIYHDGVMINLDELIPPAGYHIASAVGINDKGEIAATFLPPGSTYPALACMLSPRPVQRTRAINDAVIVTHYLLPGTVVHEESTDLVNWTNVLTHSRNEIRYDFSEHISILKPHLFRRLWQP